MYKHIDNICISVNFKFKTINVTDMVSSRPYVYFSYEDLAYLEELDILKYNNFHPPLQIFAFIISVGSGTSNFHSKLRNRVFCRPLCFFLNEIILTNNDDQSRIQHVTLHKVIAKFSCFEQNLEFPKTKTSFPAFRLN